ncbi:hypothetical protein OS493_017857 [Desmophyllum pertusum]|uniref:G-protein coupled receptors family 1 profile domain-containing protein n=1 Tax=Desmophyllum pertusum TaxID=174260 RepID=A0A9W9YZW9_9CNID|nr:hypothetical protein OS493_017857 [Desmophyllum pertusum]
MNNTTNLNTTNILLCPSLPIEVTSPPYTPHAAAQAITLLTCIVNGISCPVATVENLLVFMVVLRKRSLRTVFNTSVLCLAFTDLLIAMFIQPAFIAYQAGKYINSTYACVPYFIKTVCEFWCVGLSFITLALITLERYFAVFKPFLYRASVTRLRVMFVIFSGWIVWSVFSFSLRFSSSGMNLKAYSILSSILITFTLLETIFVYVKLYKVTRLRNRSCSLSRRSTDVTDQGQNSFIDDQETRATKTVIIITGAFFLCFAPTLCASIVHQAGAVEDDVMLHVIYPLAECALFLTALINPVIYVWRNASVRKSLKEITTFKK